MSTLLTSLQGINAYPIPTPTLEVIAESRGLELESTMTTESFRQKAYKLAKADVLKWLSQAPNVSQGGQSYSFSEDQRSQLRAEAEAIYLEEETAPSPKPRYGYKGSRL